MSNENNGNDCEMIMMIMNEMIMMKTNVLMKMTNE